MLEYMLSGVKSFPILENRRKSKNADYERFARR